MTEAEKIAQAVTEGYPDVDEVCPECKVVFKNYHHFIRCDRRPCPMSDGKGTLERLLGVTTMMNVSKEKKLTAQEVAARVECEVQQIEAFHHRKEREKEIEPLIRRIVKEEMDLRFGTRGSDVKYYPGGKG